jgi:D-serine deaminase-like pyridoxal phosphate-dependent protein
MHLQVMSVSQGRCSAVLDAGLKAVSLDSGPPVLLEQPQVAAGLLPASGAKMSFEGVEFVAGGDEHGNLVWPMGGGAWQAGPPQLPGLGQKLLLQPGHCDPTVNLYDSLVACRFTAQAGGSRVVVEGVWPVAARGPGS